MKLFKFVFLLLILTFNTTFQSGVALGARRIIKPKSQKITTNNGTKQQFVFIGCPGEEEDFKQVTQVLIATQDAWNKHQIEELLKYYQPNFISKDGMDLAKIRSNLTDFWGEYNDARIESLPSVVNVCGNYATVNLTEITDGTGQIEDPKILPYPSKFKAWVHGITTLKKTGTSWKISSEEILSEEMWKYYGPSAEKLLENGKIKLVLPTPIKENENYIAQLQYSLPDKMQALALIDKVLLTEFPEQKGDKKVTQKENKEKKKEKEIDAIRRNIEGNNDEGLRRLFTANSLGQDELVRAQIELVSFEGKGPVLSGVLGISQRVIPKPVPKEDKSGSDSLVTRSLKEEGLGESKDSIATPALQIQMKSLNEPEGL
jgi:hypothetical protein